MNFAYHKSVLRCFFVWDYYIFFLFELQKLPWKCFERDAYLESFFFFFFKKSCLYTRFILVFVVIVIHYFTLFMALKYPAKMYIFGIEWTFFFCTEHYYYDSYCYKHLDSISQCPFHSSWCRHSSGARFFFLIRFSPFVKVSGSKSWYFNDALQYHTVAKK